MADPASTCAKLGRMVMIRQAWSHCSAADACRFVARLDALLERLHAKRSSSDANVCVTVVGGGAGGVEVAFAVHHRLAILLGHQPKDSSSYVSTAHNRQNGKTGSLRVVLLARHQVLPSHPARARTLCLAAAEARGLEIQENTEVVSVAKQQLHTPDGPALQFDECLWCTQAAPASWLQETNLPKGVTASRATDSTSSVRQLLCHCLLRSNAISKFLFRSIEVRVWRVQQRGASSPSTTSCKVLAGQQRSLLAVTWPAVRLIRAQRRECSRCGRAPPWQRIYVASCVAGRCDPSSHRLRSWGLSRQETSMQSSQRGHLHLAATGYGRGRTA
jgi:Pyridine nucleotide-disulphide oxidoreductase